MVPQLYQWIGFHVLILICVYLDLKEIKESDNDVSVKHSLKLSLVWIGLALIFNIFIYFDRGAEQALNFFTSYLIEKALSLDNLFVFLAIFSFFKISPQQQKFILLQGILTALVLRLVLILVGIELLESFAWTQYFFGLFLAYTGIHLALDKEKNFDPDKSWLIKAMKKVVTITTSFSGNRLFTKQHGKLVATSLLPILIMVECTDVLFALDSIPAVLAISQDTYIVYTSNVFAILGLRSLYFCLSHLLKHFRYFKYGISLSLIFIGIKMFYVIPTEISLAILLGIFGFTFVFSIVRK